MIIIPNNNIIFVQVPKEHCEQVPVESCNNVPVQGKVKLVPGKVKKKVCGYGGGHGGSGGGGHGHGGGGASGGYHG